jgi:prophage regulatory protein
MLLIGTLTNEKALLRLDYVIELTGMSKSKIYRLIAEGRFPKPIHPAGSRISAWVAGEVDEWLTEQINKEREQVR